MYTAQFCFDGISLFIEQDVGTHTLYITESDMMSCLFIMFMMKCDKENKFVICGILLHQWNFMQAHFSMLKISLLEVMLCSFLLSEKSRNMELHTMFFCMFHTKYQCIFWNSFRTYIRP